MIKSLKGANGSFAAVGNVQVQPTVNDIGHDVKQQTTNATSIKSSALPAHEATIASPVMQLTAGEVKVTNVSLQSIANSLITDSTFLLPPFHGIANHILPSFAKNLEPADVNRAHSDQLVATAKKFEPYEQLTGISHERPEIVMLTNFLPLFIKEVAHSQPSFIQLIENGGIYPFMTDAGRFVDINLQAKYLRHTNVIHLLRDVRSNYKHVSNAFTQRRRSFERSIDSLREMSNFLLELVRSLERLKSQLDLRDDIHHVDTNGVINNYTLNFSKINSLSTSNVLYDIARRYLPSTYSVPEALVRLGYVSDNVRHKFSSTKIWMQLLLELRDILNFHSPEFIDVERVAQKKDSNAIGVTRIGTKHFGIRQLLPGLLPLNELSTLKPDQIHFAVGSLNQTWHVLYEDVHFKNSEAHIAALINMASKEFRFSYGISQPEVQQTLRDQFNYNVNSEDNQGMFDAVIGRFGNNITEFPSTQTNSLTNIAQRQPAANVAVLTFESKYVDGDSGTLTPGGSFYVDQVLRTDGRSFDTSRLDEAGDLFEKTHKSFSTIINGMNMLATKVNDQSDRAQSQLSTVLSSPVDLVREILNNLVDPRTGNTLPQAVNDNLGSVYSYAAKDNKVKSALFMYTMARITRSYHQVLPFFHVGGFTTQDNTPLTDALINEIVSSIEASVPQTLTGNQFIVSQYFYENKKFPTLTRDTIKASLKSGTVLTRFIESMMQQALSAFRNGDKAMLNRRTRFNGYLDTIIMMVIFDAVLQTVARYNNQVIISSNYGHTLYTKGTLTFNISRTTINHRSSINDLTTRIEKEVALTHKLLYTVLNTLQKLSGAFKNYSNYLKSPPAVEKLRQLSSLLGNQDMLHMLMSEQQIMMLASTVHDLVDRISQTGAGSVAGDVDGDGDFDADDELKVLDDSVVLPRLRNAIYGMMGTKEFASKKGYNKKILTVGIPLGFTRRLKQRVSLGNLKKSTFVDKQNDIVNVVVYKVDLQNSDIVYKPKRFKFELSRFPVRNDNHFLSIPEKPTIDDIVHAIPTRDFGQSFGQAQPSSSEITYWSLNTDDISKGRKAAFADESYSFLLQQEKHEIITNHITSYLLEVYVRMLTGVSLADYHFDLVDPPRPVDDELVKLVTEHHLHSKASFLQMKNVSLQENHAPTGGVLFSTTSARKPGFTSQKASAPQAASSPRLANSTGIAGNVSIASQFKSLQPNVDVRSLESQRSIGNVASNLSAVSHRNVPVLLHGLRTISNMSRMMIPLADPLSVSKRIVSPKQFDRVFNVMVDPDEFEIDYEKTVRTPHGKQALEQMILKGDIIPEGENHFARRLTNASSVSNLGTQPTGRPFVQGRSARDVSLFRFRDRDKNQGDLAFEKYFVTIETYGEDEV